MQSRFDSQTDILLGGETIVFAEKKINRPNFVLPVGLDQYGRQLTAAEARYLPAARRTRKRLSAQRPHRAQSAAHRAVAPAERQTDRDHAQRRAVARPDRGVCRERRVVRIPLGRLDVARLRVDARADPRAAQPQHRPRRRRPLRDPLALHAAVPRHDAAVPRPAAGGLARQSQSRISRSACASAWWRCS